MTHDAVRPALNEFVSFFQRDHAAPVSSEYPSCPNGKYEPVNAQTDTNDPEHRRICVDSHRIAAGEARSFRLGSTLEAVSCGGQRGIRVREDLEHLIEPRDFEN